MIYQNKGHQERAFSGKTEERPAMGSAGSLPAANEKLPYVAPKIAVIEVSIERGFASSGSPLDHLDW